MTSQFTRSAAARFTGRVALITALSLFSTAAPATAATCLDRLEQIAAAYSIDTDPPDLARNAPPATSSSDLARSGGVIEPPPTGDQAVIAPPETGSAMATVPDLGPQNGESSPAPLNGLTAADTVILDSLLVAARADAERGDEDGCLERLGEAEDVLRRARPD